MGTYNTLVAEAGYLSNVRLKVSADNGITQADLTAAQAHARAVIDSHLGAVYDISSWEAETPGIIERVADMLSSAEVLEYKYQRGDTADGDDAGLPAVLAREATALLDRLAAGRLSIVGTDGVTQPRAAAAALPSSSVAEAQFFPADSRARSFGRRTRHNLEEAYRSGGI